MLDNKEFKSLSINYFEVDWLLEHDKLVCKDAHFVNLFKSIRHKMGKSKSIAKIVGPTLIVMVFSEMRFWNPTLYDTQIVPLIIF